MDRADSITGSVGSLGQQMQIDVVSAPVGMPPSAGNRLIKNVPAVLTGNLHYQDLTIRTGAIVTIAGATRILCDGNFSIEQSSEILLAPGATLELYAWGFISIRNTVNINANPELVTYSGAKSETVPANLAERVTLNGGIAEKGATGSVDVQAVIDGLQAELPRSVQNDTLMATGAKLIALRKDGTSRLLAVAETPPGVDEQYDLSDVSQVAAVREPPRAFHQLDIAADGRLAWNGAALPAEQLPRRLLQLAADPATPELRLNPDGEARYGWIDQILAQIRFAGVGRLGFIGNERYAAAF